MSILDVTSGQVFATVSAAITGSGAGDVIAIDAGLYVEDFPKITHALTLQGNGGLARLTTPGTPLNGQGIVVVRADVTLQSLELVGAAVADGNGAGVRVELGNLVVRDSHIHDNQDGILVNNVSGITVSIARSEIDHNGADDGFSHNVYIGRIDRFTLTDSYIHDAIGGHEVKSRALANVISGSRLQDQDGDSGYSIDLPDGGTGTVTGNTLAKGIDTQNRNFVHFGGELYPSNPGSLTVSDNDFINGRGFVGVCRAERDE